MVRKFLDMSSSNSKSGKTISLAAVAKSLKLLLYNKGVQNIAAIYLAHYSSD